MIFYQVQDVGTGLFYKKGSFGGDWVEQQEADAWTNKQGPAGVKANLKRRRSKRCIKVITIDTENPNGKIDL